MNNTINENSQIVDKIKELTNRIDKLEKKVNNNKVGKWTNSAFLFLLYLVSVSYFSDIIDLKEKMDYLINLLQSMPSF